MKAQSLSTNRISSLPQNIIETILCLVSLREAVRTSILSREWRYHWTKIPKLKFNYTEMFDKSTDKDELSILEQTFEEPPSERKHLTKRCKVFYAIFQVLLLHVGPLLEFNLYINAKDYSVEIDQIIRHLSKNKTLKKLTLQMKYIFPYRLPVSIFSWHHVTELDLRECYVDIRQIFNVSGSLTSLFMADVFIDAKTFLHLTSSSPLLKSLNLVTSEYTTNPNGLTCPSYFVNYDNSTINELFESLPVIEHLSVSIWLIKCFIGDAVPRELPTKLVHLKYLHLDDICFIDKHGLPFLVCLIRCSPNLEKIKLVIYPEFADAYSQSEIDSVTLEEYSDLWLEHLIELTIVNFGNWKSELEFIKLILVKSPALKKVRIVPYYNISSDEEQEMFKYISCDSRD